MFKSLALVPRRKAQTVLTLRAANPNESAMAGQALIREAKEYGLGLREFLDLAIDVRGSDTPEAFQNGNGVLSGYEATLALLNLPVGDNFSAGHVLDAASDTFQTYPGTRALFPAVIDDVVKYKYRQNAFETTEAIVAQSRTVNGVEMISTVVDDVDTDYQNVRAVAEFGRFPVRTIRTGETAVKFWKHGGGLRISYEFARRARLDMLTPYNNRSVREMEMSKTLVATAMLINGDGVSPAAGVVLQSVMDGVAAGTTIRYKGLLQWLVNRAKAGVPVDTVVGNWDAYIQWLMMFAIPTSANVRTDAENLAAAGFQAGGVPILTGIVNFALSSGVPAGQLIGLSKADTLEELVEAGSTIDESERAIVNQSITYTKSENAGYKLVFGDTRSIYNYLG